MRLRPVCSTGTSLVPAFRRSRPLSPGIPTSPPTCGSPPTAAAATTSAPTARSTEWPSTAALSCGRRSTTSPCWPQRAPRWPVGSASSSVVGPRPDRGEGIMTTRWYQEAVIYCIDVASFQDSDGDGVGDLRGLISRLDYLARLGVTCLWLNPIHPSPGKDNGYDVADYYGVHPRLGSLGDFAELGRRARERGIRIVLDLVVNHTSDEHPWFVAARSDPASPYRDWYVWSETEPPDRQQGVVFPGEQEETWSFDEQAGAWYFHRFYGFQPDLNCSHPEVRPEIAKVMGFWLQLGASGFRIDAAPFVLEQIEPGVDPGPQDFSILDSWRQETQWQAGDSVLLCEANVAASDVAKFTGSRPDGPCDRAQLMFDFLLNPKIWLALARRDAEPLVEALKIGVRLPEGAQWVTFLRNHDELDLSRLTDE